jgi:hypothetical protein
MKKRCTKKEEPPLQQAMEREVYLQASDQVEAHRSGIALGAAGHVGRMQHITTAVVAHHDVEEGTTLCLTHCVQPRVEEAQRWLILLCLALVQQCDDTGEDGRTGAGTIRWLQVVSSPHQQVVSDLVCVYVCVCRWVGG